MNMFKDKKLYIFLFINILFFGILIKMNYSVDTYLLLASPKLEYVREYLSSGRIFTTLFFSLLGLIRTPGVVMYTLSYLTGILCSTLAIYELNKILDKYVKNKLLSILLSIFLIINPFVIELWLFIEMGIMMFSILAIVEAFKYFDLYLDKNNKKYFIISFIFMLLSLFSYQGTAALFISLSLISILYKSKKSIKNVFINTIKSGLIYLVPAIINYIFILLLSTKRVGGTLTIESIIDNIFKTTSIIFQGFGLYPKGFILLLVIISLIISIFYIIKSKYKNIAILNIIYIFFMVYIFTLAPNIIQTSDRVAIYPRTCYAFFSYIGIILVIVNKKINYKLLCAYLICILLIEFLVFTRIEINRHIVNNNDRYIILKIEEKIKEYEKSNNTRVTKLAIYNMERSIKFYDNIRDNINVSAIKERPSGLAAYSLLTERRLEYVESDNNIFNNHFKNIRSNRFEMNQIVIIGDSIHWYLY